MKNEPPHLETLAVHAGHEPDPATGAVAPPIHPSTTFVRDPDGGYARGHMYVRNSNPNRKMLEDCIAALDGAASGAAFASGQAAMTAILQSLRPGDHVILPTDIYWGTMKLVNDALVPWGLEASFVDMTDLDAVRAAVRPQTRLLWVETPSNPLLRITDIAGVAKIAKAAGAKLACDNTWGTPVLTKPFELGADLIVHATTKYLGGHSDVLGGVVSTRVEDEFFERVRLLQATTGGVPSPFDCWLVLRGIRTLVLRVERQCESAARIADWLAAHPKVEAVHYPGLASHPGHAIAARQMRRFGAMLSFQVKGGEARAFEVAARVGLFTRATSLGGVESLIEHRATIEGPDTKTPRNLLRVSVGVEHVDDLIADLDQALG
jgi:cystathionine gamma-synthase